MDQKSTSLWIATTRRPRFEPLRGEVRADVVVIGAGITGLTAALLLSERGRRVVVLERRSVGSGETGNTTAHVTSVVDAGYAWLQRRYGTEETRLVASGLSEALEAIARRVDQHGIECRFRRVPAYTFTEHRNEVAGVKKEAAAASDAGIDAEWVTEVPLPFETRGAAVFRNQAQFHPLEYLDRLAELAVARGASIHEGSMVTKIERGETNLVETENGGRVLAQHVLQATNTPAFGFTAVYTKGVATRTYAVAFESDADVEGLFWDTADPYHYVRWQDTGEGRFMIVGGEDHRVGHGSDGDEPFDRLVAWTRERFGDLPVRDRWSGQIFEPHGGIPLIGGSDGMYVSTGYSGQGMTLGTLGAMIVSDRISGVENRWADVFRHDRLIAHAMTTDYVKENLPFVEHVVEDRLTKRDVEAESAADVGRGEGKITEIGGRKVALFRDDSGTLHALSPVCTHMKCDVAWNAAERSWDCPCHGSRFRPDGAVLNGPAHEPLKAVSIGGGDVQEEGEDWRRERDSNPR